MRLHRFCALNGGDGATLKPDTMSTASSGDIDKQALGIKTTDVCILDNIDNLDSKKQAVEELKPERTV
jgi:hypothetical protein